MRWVNAHKGASLLIVAAVLAVVGTWLVRSSATPSEAGEVAPTAVTGASTTPPSSTGTVGSVAASSVQSTAPIASLAGGSQRLEVPVDPSGSRHRRDEASVRQVAIDYLSTVKQRALYMAPAEVPALLEAWAAPGVVVSEWQDTAAQLAHLRDALTAAGGEVWWVVSPLAVKVEAFDLDRARVSVWTATVIASGAAPGVDTTVAAPQVVYRTGTVELVWDELAGWSVWSNVESPGPVPMAATDQAPSGPAEFLTALSGFSLIREHR